MSNRSPNPLEALSDSQRDNLQEEKSPRWIEPMLATLTDERFSDEHWLFERKLDGERCLAYRDGASVALFSRNKHRLNSAYPEVVDALTRQPRERLTLDGEIVAFDGAVTSFSRLQKRMQIRDEREARASAVSVYYYVFDLLHLDGFQLTGLALRDRKKLLRRALEYKSPLRFTPHRNTEGEAYYRAACEKGWEGVIAKRANSRYQHGRSRDWLKFKCVNQQEFVIGGFTDPEGERIGFGALLIGYYDKGELVYAGKVGAGYDNETLADLSDRLARKEIDKPPFAGTDAPRKNVHWVKPELVGAVAFTEWTHDDRVRHPRFLGLRRDKPPKRVRRERPK